MSFAISDKVVCVDDTPSTHGQNWHPSGHIKKGVVYVVKGRSPVGGLQVVGKPVVSLLTNTELGWRTCRFRKLSEIQAENAAKQRMEKSA